MIHSSFVDVYALYMGIERALLAELQFPAHLEWLRLIYRTKLDQHDPCSDTSVVATATTLEAFGIKYCPLPNQSSNSTIDVIDGASNNE